MKNILLLPALLNICSFTMGQSAFASMDGMDKVTQERLIDEAAKSLQGQIFRGKTIVGKPCQVEILNLERTGSRGVMGTHDVFDGTKNVAPYVRIDAKVNGVDVALTDIFFFQPSTTARFRSNPPIKESQFELQNPRPNGPALEVVMQLNQGRNQALLGEAQLTEFYFGAGRDPATNNTSCVGLVGSRK